MHHTQLNQLWFIPHNEIGTPINDDFIIPTATRTSNFFYDKYNDIDPGELPDFIKPTPAEVSADSNDTTDKAKWMKKPRKIKLKFWVDPRDPNSFRIPNTWDRKMKRFPLNPELFRESLLIIDSNPLAWFEVNHLRRLWVDVETWILSAPTVVKVCIYKLRKLLDPYFVWFPRLGHAVSLVQSGAFSAASRTHRILALWLNEFYHWDGLVSPKRESGIVTFDALLRWYRWNEKIEDILYTPGDEKFYSDGHFTWIPSWKWSAAKSQSRIDPTGRWSGL